MRYLRKLCGTFDILPSSFILPPTSVERDNIYFASSGFANVYSATFNGRPVVVKFLTVTVQTDQVKLRKVSGFGPKTSRRSLTPDL